MPIRVAIVEDDPVIRASLQRVIQNEGDLKWVGSYGSSEEFIARNNGLEELDVVMMDINLPGINGVECIATCKPKQPKVQYLMSTVLEDHENVFNALCQGATGYLLKSAPPEQVVRSIHEIHGGGSPMSMRIARMVVEHMPQKKNDQALLEKLTKREREVLDHLAAGYRYKEIADRMGLKIDTVRSYIRDIYTTLQVQSRTDALNKVFAR